MTISTQEQIALNELRSRIREIQERREVPTESYRNKDVNGDFLRVKKNNSTVDIPINFSQVTSNNSIK